MNVFRTMLAAVFLSISTAALPHDFWLMPAEFRLAGPGEVSVAFNIGDGATPEPWNLRWENIVALRSHGPDGVTDQQATITPRTEQSAGGAALRLATRGTHMIAFESNPNLSDLEAERFNAYAEDEGLTAVIAERERSGTTGRNGSETYARRGKALVQVGATLTDQVLKPVGHTLEIVPEKHPYGLGAEGRLPIQVLYRGRPLAGAKVSLIDLRGDGEPLVDVVTDAAGRAVFAVPPRSAWRLNVVWSVPVPGILRADFDTIFTSLTFGYQ